MKKNATKKDLIQSIADDMDCTQRHVAEIFQKCMDAITDALVEQGRIEFRNFGIYAVKKRKSRTALNPRTGEKVQTEEKFVVTFTPGKKMSERLNEARNAAKASEKAGRGKAVKGARKASDAAAAVVKASKAAKEPKPAKEPKAAEPKLAKEPKMVKSAKKEKRTDFSHKSNRH